MRARRSRAGWPLQTRLKDHLYTLLLLVGAIWLVSLVNIYADQALSVYGIHPRQPLGLIGLFTWPLLHGSYLHLLQNTTPLLILSGVILLQDERRFGRLTLYICVIGGVGVWLFGRPGVHIGASGLVFGYFGYIVSRGLYDGRFASLAVALVVTALYGGLIWGVFPSDPYVSWEGHLFGLLAGGVYARSRSRRTTVAGSRSR